MLPREYQLIPANYALPIKRHAFQGPTIQIDGFGEAYLWGGDESGNWESTASGIAIINNRIIEDSAQSLYRRGLYDLNITFYGFEVWKEMRILIGVRHQETGLRLSSTISAEEDNTLRVPIGQKYRGENEDWRYRGNHTLLFGRNNSQELSQYRFRFMVLSHA